MNDESKFWARQIDRDELSEYIEDNINIMQRSREDPGKLFYLTHEVARKANDNIIQDVDTPTIFKEEEQMFYIFVGRRDTIFIDGKKDIWC